jgi:TRAP transporter 4TM/12TM fusion protein
VSEQVDDRTGEAGAVAVGGSAAGGDIRDLVDSQSFTEAMPKHRAGQHPIWRGAVFLLALALSLFHLYTAFVGTLPSHQQRTFHLGFGLGLIFLVYPAKRPLPGRERWAGWMITALALAALWLLYSSGAAATYVVLPAAGIVLLLQAARHLPWTVLGMPVADALLSALGFAAGLYLCFNSDPIIRAAGRLPTTDPAVTPFFVIGTIGVLLVLAAAQRAIGSALTVLAAVMLGYAYLGPYMPGFLNHRGFLVDRIIAHSYLGTEGVFGIPIGVSSTFIFLFMIFAALLQRTGMERFFTRLALGLAGGFTGGTAKVGVLTSAFSGTITGSSVANTVSNGAFTIPMMRRSGYKPEFAGAVEAASSTGGQFAPPIMGAAAFIMIEMTPPEIGYLEIIKAAAVPAALFFVAQFIVIHYESKRLGIRGVPREQLPSVRRLLAVQGYLLAPIILIFVILASGFTPMRAALWAIIATVVINLVVQLVTLVVGALRRGPPPDPPPLPPLPEQAHALRRLAHRTGRQGAHVLGSAPAWVRRSVAQWRALDDKLTPRTLLAGLVDAARLALPIIAACAAAGLIAGVITLTGLGFKLIDGLLALGMGNLLLTLFFVMIACLVLGIGVPTTANYVITATLAAPVIWTLLQGDLESPTLPMILTAHLFVYYFGVMADITPPVCLAAYAAAGISGGNPLLTGVWSVRIAVSGFIVPYMFVLNPQLLLLEVTPAGAVGVIVTALVGVTCLGAAVAGYLSRPLSPVMRLVLVAAGLLLLAGSLWTDVLGFGIFAVVFGYDRWTGRQSGPAGPALVPRRAAGQTGSPPRGGGGAEG